MKKDIKIPEILSEREGEIKRFLKVFDTSECDPRKKRGRLFALGEIFLIILCAQLCGLESLREYELYRRMKKEFLQKFYPYRRGTPKKSTFAIMLSLFDPKKFEKIFFSWQTMVQSERPISQHKGDNNVKDEKTPSAKTPNEKNDTESQRQIAIDGKSHNGFQSSEAGDKLHLLHAYDTATGMLIGQTKVGDKTKADMTLKMSGVLASTHYELKYQNH